MNHRVSDRRTVFRVIYFVVRKGAAQTWEVSSSGVKDDASIAPFRSIPCETEAYAFALAESAASEAVKRGLTRRAEVHKDEVFYDEEPHFVVDPSLGI